MKDVHTIKINFKGGIISPGELLDILSAAENAKVNKVSFGIRQQLVIKVSAENAEMLRAELKKLNVFFEIDSDIFPNVMSSYPAEEVFISNTWLSEGVYKDIFDLMEYQPKLKVNICDSNQSFTPLLTGNINWVASMHVEQFWHVFIRFPKTNVIYEWDQLVYTNDLARMSRQIEQIIFEYSYLFYNNAKANGNELFEFISRVKYITKPAEAPAILPGFNLPYYEGFNHYQDKNWLGIYRRDELFSIDFLKDVCQLCLHTKVGQLCSTPWKSMIIKGIVEKDRPAWNRLLAQHQINMRHAANELNFQVEDNCEDGLALKHYLLNRLHKKDVRTFGLCIGIKTRAKSEVFSSILVRKRSLIAFAGFKLFPVYDILCAKDFNPNERTGFIFSKGNTKRRMAEKLQLAIVSFHHHKDHHHQEITKNVLPENILPATLKPGFVYQCIHCFSVYDEKKGEPENGIAPGVSFEDLPGDYGCALCAAPKHDLEKVEKSKLGLEAA